MNVVIVVDAIERLRPETDTSVGLMHAAQSLGADVWVTTPPQLFVADGRACALATPVRLMASVPADGCTWVVPQPWMVAGPAEQLVLDDTAAVFMWVEPPLTEAYLTASFVLDLVRGAPVINSPSGVRSCSEHLLPLRFPELVPPTLVSADRRRILEFVAFEQKAVLKPVDSFSGHGVYMLVHEDPNLASLVETATAMGTRQVIVQRHLPEVEDGNKRVFVLDGRPVGAVFRFPTSGDFRIGEPSARAPVTSADRRICARLAPVLAAHGLRVAGLDVIGSALIEVNVTSPGALRKADALVGWSLCADVVATALATKATCAV